MKLYYLAQPGDGFGWGVANTNIIRALEKLGVEVICSPRTRVSFDAPLFVPIQYNRDLRPDVPWAAPKVIGYTFSEVLEADKARRNARAYDLIFCGSTWNTQLLRNAGIKHVDTLIQGIDSTIFKPKPPSDRNGFVVFSGGKYEFRKGQDYVLAAMKCFMAVRTDAVLMASWENQWAQSILTMRSSWLIDFERPLKGLDESRVILLPPVPNIKTPELYAQAHIGLFPNRCEAGTNLVMSEFMACERPVIASYAHGHKDVFCENYRLLLRTGAYDAAGWFNPEVSDIISALEWAYNNREELPALGTHCAEMASRFTWQACAQKIYQAAFDSLPEPAGLDSLPAVPASE